MPVDLAALRAANPALVTVSISPFGSTGPKADWPATDLTVLAAGCQLAITGDDDRAAGAHRRAPGVPARRRPTPPSARCWRSTERAAQRAAASTSRSRRSARCCRPRRATSLAVPLGGAAAQRMSGGVKTGGLDVQLLWPCKDGFVSVTFLFGASIGPFTRRLMNVDPRGGLLRRGDARQGLARLRQPCSTTGASRSRSTSGSRASSASSAPTKTKAELLEAACARIAADRPGRHARRRGRTAPQFAARDYWDHVDDDALLERPGARARAVACARRSSPPIRLGRAPRLGEHTDEVLRRAPRRRARCAGGRRPAAARAAARRAQGARPDVGDGRPGDDAGDGRLRRHGRPRRDRATTSTWPARSARSSTTRPATTPSGLLFNMTTGKRSISLDLRQPLGPRRCSTTWSAGPTSWSSRSRRAAGAALGLDYERLAELNPALIMMSSCLFGQSGPLRALRRVRHDGRLAGRLLPPHRLARPAAVRPVRRLQRLPVAALRAVRAARRPRPPPAHGRGPVPRLRPGRGVRALPHAGDARPRRQRPRRDAATATPTRTWRPTACTRAPATTRWVAIACRDDADWRALAGAARPRTTSPTSSPAERPARRDELDDARRPRGRPAALGRRRA